MLPSRSPEEGPETTAVEANESSDKRLHGLGQRVASRPQSRLRSSE